MALFIRRGMWARVSDTDVVPNLRSSHPSGRETRMKNRMGCNGGREGGRLAGLQLGFEDRAEWRAGLNGQRPGWGALWVLA